MNNCTYIAICSLEYINYYKELCNSIKKHSPNSNQILYYIGEPLEIYDPIFDKVVDINDWFENCKSDYNTLERICSLRARVVLDAFQKGYEKVIFCGAKLKFFDSPYLLESLLNDYNAVVTPHITSPLPEDGLFPSNEQVSFTGHISTDLVGFKHVPEVVKFLTWQDEIMKTKCKTTEKTYLDQSWLNFLPFFINKVKILHHPGYNVAYWNYKERNLSKVNNKWTTFEPETNWEHSLVCFQFSGLDLNAPEKISTHQNRYIAEGDFLEFLQDYVEKVK